MLPYSQGVSPLDVRCFLGMKCWRVSFVLIEAFPPFVICGVMSLLWYFCVLMRANAAYPSSAVDVYSSATGVWTTAQLSAARSDLAATSIGNVALFAGGFAGSAFWCRDEMLEEGLLAFNFGFVIRCCIFFLF
jgi:hypothetical protein